MKQLQRKDHYLRTNGDNQTSIRHIKVAACAGDQESMNCLVANYRNKLLSKDDLTQTLRAFQASRDEMKSKDRDDAQAMKGMAAILGID